MSEASQFKRKKQHTYPETQSTWRSSPRNSPESRCMAAARACGPRLATCDAGPFSGSRCPQRTSPETNIHTHTFTNQCATRQATLRARQGSMNALRPSKVTADDVCPRVGGKQGAAVVKIDDRRVPQAQCSRTWPPRAAQGWIVEGCWLQHPSPRDCWPPTGLLLTRRRHLRGPPQP